MYTSVCSCLRGLVKRVEFPTAGVTSGCAPEGMGAVHHTSGREAIPNFCTSRSVCVTCAFAVSWCL